MPRPESFSLRGVETLRVHGRGADTMSVAGLVNLCPRLVHLELFTWVDEADFSALLPLLPATLRSLRLDSTGGTNRPCDSFLPRFRQLRRVHLGHGCYSQSIHRTLAQLPDLVTIRFGSGMDDYQTLASLVSGPDRLVDLKSIALDGFYMCRKDLMGIRTPAPSDPSFSTGDAAIEVNMTDWALPSSHRPDPVSLRELARLCDSNGVDLSGTMLKCLETLDAFHLESNNRAVLAVVFGPDDTFNRIRDVRSAASRAGVCLPTFDLDSLDPDNLEIVETALPEKDWFVLSLRNKTKQEE
ncbi:hypothetical protein JCM11491_000041 [Sporobolomyces phaffii]